MAGDFEQTLRGPQAYKITRKAIDMMERHNIWPTPLNFELWSHFVAEPEGALAKELTRLISAGEPMTESVSEELAAAYLAKAKLNEQIRDAGDQLTKELAAVAKAIQTAQQSTNAYGKTLSTASQGLDAATDAAGIKKMVETLTTATERVQKQNDILEKKLSDSTTEVARLREHLEQVRRDATTDGLTNLANRKAFDDELAPACADADEQGAEFAMIFPGEDAATVEACLEEIRDEVASRMLKRRSTNEDLGTVTLPGDLPTLPARETADWTMACADA
eukprot:gene19437-19329_t